MKKNETFVFYCGIFIYLLMMYRSSWLPGGKLIMSIDIYIIDLILYSIMIIFFSFNKLFDYKFNINGDNFLLYILFMLFLISTFIYNSQEFLVAKNLFRMFSYFSYVSIFFFWIPEILVTHKNYFKKFILLITVIGILASTLGLILLFTGMNPIVRYKDTLISIITHPNNASIIFTYTTITTLFFLFYYKDSLGLLTKLFLITSFVLQFTAQLYTFTRAGIIATIIGLTIFFIFYYRKKFLIILPIIVITFPSVLYYFLFYKKGFASLSSRFYLLIPAYHMLADFPSRMFWGYGLTDSFLKYKEFRFLYNVTEESINDPHNTFVMLTLMLGILFTIVILIFLLSMLIRSLYALIKTKDKKESLVYSYLISIIIAIFVQGIFDSELILTEYYTLQILLIMSGIMYLFLKDKTLVLNLMRN